MKQQWALQVSASAACITVLWEWFSILSKTCVTTILASHCACQATVPQVDCLLCNNYHSYLWRSSSGSVFKKSWSISHSPLSICYESVCIPERPFYTIRSTLCIRTLKKDLILDKNANLSVLIKMPQFCEDVTKYFYNFLEKHNSGPSPRWPFHMCVTFTHAAQVIFL